MMTLLLRNCKKLWKHHDIAYCVCEGILPCGMIHTFTETARANISWLDKRRGDPSLLEETLFKCTERRNNVAFPEGKGCCYIRCYTQEGEQFDDYVTVICKELETLVEGNGQPETTL